MTDEYSAALQQAQKDMVISAQSVSKSEQSAIRAENIAEGIWAFDVRNNRIYWSNSLFDMLEMPRQESPLTLKLVMTLIHSEDREAFEKVIQTSLSTGDPFEAELRMRYGSGPYLTVQLGGKVYLDDRGKPSRISGRLAQITKQQQTESALEKANKDLADLRHALDESTILSVTDRYGIITYINDALCRISQYSQEELMGDTLQIINSSYHPQAFFKEIWDRIGQGEIWRGEIRNQAKDGSYFWMDTTIVPLLDVNGESFQYIVVRHDITGQKASEQKVLELRKNLAEQVDQRTAKLENINLAQSQEIEEQKEIEVELKKSLKREKLTKHLIQLMNRSFNPDIILEVIVRELGTFFDVDRCLVILYKNEIEEIEGLRVFAQYCRSEAIRPILEEEIPWDEWKELPKKQSKNPPSDKPHLGDHQVQSAFSTEIKYRHVAFGRLVLHQCNHLRTWTEQEIDFLEILATHIGAALYQVKLYQGQKQARKEAEEANRQKSKVLSFVSHDFKNPLASIKRFTDILENDKSDILSEKHRELIGYIAEGVHQLRNMVRDILDKARLAEGKIHPIPQWIEIRSFIDELKPLFDSMASQRNIKVHIEIQPELTALKADSTHLRQILINLVSNAVKYNRVGSTAFLRFYKSEDGQSAVIDVQDSGPGIPQEKIPQLFTEYFRADLSQSNLIEGTGLGLAFIKKLIELHGGSISVESEVGIGSIFRVTLPLSINPIEPNQQEA